MKNFSFSLIVLFFLFTSAQSDALLRQKIGQMIIVGFPGLTVDDSVAYDIQSRNLGGVILLGYNLEAKRQIINLNKTLKGMAQIPLFIAIDQEGGFVARLDEQNGFEETASAYHLGTEINREDSTRFTADLMAGWLDDMGFNLNLAPVVDVDVNPISPAIGRWGRSFSADAQDVVVHAQWFIEEMHDQRIMSALKHFPGHGSAKDDSHLGFTDITQTWIEDELLPYSKLIENDYPDMIMSGHLYHAGFDDQHPASLSDKLINGLLRDSLKYNGVVITDEMSMRAISDNYGFETAVKLAVNAGNDILLYSANLKDGKSLPNQLISIIEQAVNAGEIDRTRIDQSYQRIMDLKNKYLVTAITANDKILPEQFEIKAYPNPFNNRARIEIRFEDFRQTDIDIFDSSGKRIKSLFSNINKNLTMRFIFNASDLASGVYFIRVNHGNHLKTVKLILLK